MKWLRNLLPSGMGGPKKVVPGHLTQYAGVGNRSERIQLVIGFDFGTAFTKIVIGERRRAYAVPLLGTEKQSNPYLLPCVLSVFEDGRLELGAASGASHCRDLKMRILEGRATDEDIVAVTAFVALALQKSRQWFLSTHRGSYGRYRLEWTLNIGLPTEQYHDDGLVAHYKEIVRAAWLASTLEEPLDFNAVSECFADSSGSIGEDSIAAFPEFVAQINGYVRSPMRRPDLHLLVDVGAGTVDVAAFNVHQRDGEDIFPVFSKSVSLLGVHFLHKHRIKSGSATSVEPSTSIEGAEDKDVARVLGLRLDQLKAIDAPFARKLRERIQEDVATAKRKYPMSRHWENGVPFFLCGGGSHVGMYKDLADQMVRSAVPCRLTPIGLPRPERLEAPALPDQSYDRMSVAYGLSFDAYDIGGIIPSHMHEDLEGDAAIQASQCPACSGTGGGMANSCSRCGGSGWVGA